MEEEIQGVNWLTPVHLENGSYNIVVVVLVVVVVIIIVIVVVYDVVEKIDLSSKSNTLLSSPNKVRCVDMKSRN